MERILLAGLPVLGLLIAMAAIVYAIARRG